ncbi:MAG: DUF2480 family protein [Saprospiraceae bacterium]
MESQLVNRVASSGIVTLNLEDYFPKHDFLVFDISQFLFHGLILKEKEFRLALKEEDWTTYSDKIILIQCSTDAIIPLWAYMLISNYLTGTAKDVFVGSQEEYIKSFMVNALHGIDWTQYSDQRIVVKGCGNKPVPADAYARITQLLRPFVKSIMFGEPCSTVPVFKKPLV